MTINPLKSLQTPWSSSTKNDLLTRLKCEMKLGNERMCKKSTKDTAMHLKTLVRSSAELVYIA